MGDGAVVVRLGGFGDTQLQGPVDVRQGGLGRLQAKARRTAVDQGLAHGGVALEGGLKVPEG